MEFIVGDRVRFKEYEHRGKEGNVRMVCDGVIVVDLDTFHIPVATMEYNLEKI